MEKLCVIGLGYIGLPTSIMFAKHGFQVHGVDVNQQVIEKLTNKELHIEEPGLQEALEEVVDAGKLTFAKTPVESDVFIVAVPSPITEEKTANLDYVRAGTEAIVPFVKKGDLVILESTVPPRTVEDVMMPILEKTGLNLNEELYIAHSPERVIPGKIFQELEENDRIVGGINEKSSELTKQLYKSFVKGDIHLTDATTAEMVKVIENTYRDVNIAFANELAKISDKIGVNAWEAIKLANYHPRVNIHQPGPGVGGHCIAVDPWFLAELQPDLANMITLARNTNDGMPAYTVERIQQIIEEHNLVQPTVALLGLSFKGNVDDMRESPSLTIMEHLNRKNIDYKVFDPHIKDVRVPHQVLQLDEVIQDADIAVILTDHKVFQTYDPNEVKQFMKESIIFDTKNCIDEAAWRDAGFNYIRLGDAKNR
ncbi:nucleotide sugar dehydrogenase [Aquibacillus albus]|uniref:UDP-N-acetyl-D-mannosaminuronic acid dehydrogenase n=1 Tax=Aquibacillus albus TaxID=1168171 RepID=A0ABS2N0D6_9BACI|nr:nucleotide sugar dehydrogenase [Aquibacillus albus]MBM7571365.1 UDP-N-acetyl-D-mannosaminuronic acid dehydrogenase [Aquibacillus albus]